MFNTFGCFIIGEGTLPIQCAEILLRYGHTIYGIGTTELATKNWAEEKGIPCISPIDGDMAAILGQSSFEYIFSIANPYSLPGEILALPDIGTINCHDAPLPNYAGFHTISWALMQGEHIHGLTWHEMTEHINIGNIYKWSPIIIDSAETAFTLQRKCHATTIRSFTELIKDLSSRSNRPFKQDLNKRTYFPPSKRPAAGCLIDWNRPLHEIDAFVRALDYGPMVNELGCPKLHINENFFLVPQVSIARRATDSPPGTLIQIDDHFLIVSSCDGELHIPRLLTIDGRPLPLASFVEQYGLYTGYRFEMLLPDIGERITTYNETICQHEAFWVSQLAGFQSLIPSHLYKKTAHTQLWQQRQIKLSIPAELVQLCKDHCGLWQQSDFLISAFTVYLARIYNTNFFDIGFTHPGIEEKIQGLEGFFSDYVPLRVDFDDDQTFTVFYHQMQKNIEQVKDKKTYARDIKARYPALQTFANFPDSYTSHILIEQVKQIEDYKRNLSSEFSLIISNDQTECLLAYDTSVIDEDKINLLSDNFVSFIQYLVLKITTHSEQRLGEISLLTLTEQEQILTKWNAVAALNPQVQNIHQLFEEQVRRTPDIVALVSGDQQITYSVLNQQANQLAYYLHELGIALETPVGLYTRRSPEMIIGIMGIFKAGATYVPLDPMYPYERLAFMLQDANVHTVLTQKSLAINIPQMGNIRQVVSLDQDWPTIIKQQSEDIYCNVTSNNQAYIIYTSGSTGNPKGVMIEHRGICNLHQAQVAMYQIAPGSRILQFASPGFVISITEILRALFSGATLCLEEQEVLRSIHALGRTLNEYAVTAVTLPPALLMLLPDEELPRLRTVTTAGDIVPAEVIARWTNRHHLYIHYGLTEITTSATIIQCRPGQPASSIGKPVANAQVYTLDQYMELVPIGVPGEVYIGGVGLARGYINQPDLTAERFVPNPFSKEAGARLYRTGDRASFRPDGTLEFLGRVDGQIKLRGYRIEPTEVETALNQHPAIQQSVVIAREDTPNNKYLIAYICEKGQTDALSAVDLHKFLQKRLPDYMIPAVFVPLETFPLTPNGKIDRRALPVPDISNRLPGGTEYVSARTAMEEVVVDIWQQLFGLEQIGINDNFFALGGHSLLATQVMVHLRDIFQVELALQTLFETPTVVGLAQVLQQVSQAPLPLPPLVPQPRAAEGVPLSFAQQRLWFLQQMEPKSAFYAIPTTLSLHGSLQIAALERSFRELIHRHEILRTTFSVRNGTPLQMVASHMELSMPLIDLQALSKEQKRDEAVALLSRQFINQPFDLQRGPLLRVCLLRLEEAEYILLLNLHHIISDGWSAAILMRELNHYYQMYVHGTSTSLPFPTIQYADYALWQRQWLQGEILQSQLSYWQKQLAGAPTLLNLPLNYARPAIQRFQGAMLTDFVPPSLTQQLKELSQDEGVTLFMALVSAFFLLLARYSGEQDIVIGTALANRTRREIEGLIGFFSNTLLLRCKMHVDLSIHELLQQVRKVALGAYAHQDVPFEKLVEELQPERSLSYHPLFQVMFIFHNQASEQMQLSGLQSVSILTHNRTAKRDLSVAITETAQGLAIRWEYDTDLFAAQAMQQMLRHYILLLQALVQHRNGHIHDINLLTTQEYQQLLFDWNPETSISLGYLSIGQRLYEQARQTPDAIALVYEQQCLSYHDLEERAIHLAHVLLRLGLEGEQRVGLCLDRGPDLIIALLAVLHTGGAYVTLDPEYPWERLHFMIQDAGVSIVITHASLQEHFQSQSMRVLLIDQLNSQAKTEIDLPPAVQIFPENLAYVIYTSGSTGRPKGTMITHSNVNHYIEAMTTSLDITLHDRYLHTASFSFSSSVRQILLPLFQGARVVLASIEQIQDPRSLFTFIQQQQVTILDFVPSYWLSCMHALLTLQQPVRNQLLQNTVRLLVSASEPLAPHIPRLWKQTLGQPSLLINMFGQTETAGIVATYPLSSMKVEHESNIPLGRPLASCQLYLLDQQQQPVPVGVTGEIYIGGDDIARGYLGQAALTAERFLPHPFSKKPGMRLYRTGDLGRYRYDGTLLFLGRADTQTKVRGYRIELSEIEHVLMQHPVVEDAVVLARSNNDATREDIQLSAYLIPKDEQQIKVEQIRYFLRQQLPDYMIPLRFVALDAFPLTFNGKVDRRALPAPEISLRVSEEQEYIIPRSPLEEIVAEIWEQVLGLAQISVNDDFFALGGHSLLATQVMARLHDAFQVEMPLRTLFEIPTIAELSTKLEQVIYNQQRSSIPPLQPISRLQPLPPSFAQQRLWFLDQLVVDNPFYNVPLVLQLTGKVDRIALWKSLYEILQRHEALRTNIVVEQEQPIQSIQPVGAITTSLFRIIDLRSLPADRQTTIVKQISYQEARHHFNLARDVLLRAKLLWLSEQRAVLLLTLHHIASDGWSQGILHRELSTLYNAFVQGDPSPLAALPVQYADFALWQRHWLQGEVLERYLQYWRVQLRDLPTLELLTDFPRPAIEIFQGAYYHLLIPRQLTQELKVLSQQVGATLFMTLLTVFATLLLRYSGQADLPIGTPIANRTQRELEGLIGFFVNTLVLRCDLAGDPTFLEAVQRVREMTLSAYAYQDLPFERLVEALQPERTLSHNPLCQVLFQLQNTPSQPFELHDLSVQQLNADGQTARFDLVLSLIESEQGLLGRWDYNRDLFTDPTIERMSTHYLSLLENVVKVPQQRLSRMPLLTERDLQQLLDSWNATRIKPTHQQCMHHLFEEQVLHNLDTIALVDHDAQLTYGMLNQWANQLAYQLRDLGIGPEHHVGVCLKRSLEQVVSLLAIFKAGGAYVPLDPDYSHERLAFMLVDAQIEVLVTHEALLPTSLLSQLYVRQCRLVDPQACRESDLSLSQAGNLRAIHVEMDHPAYILYTSGSTGQPKGVEITHQGLSNLICWHQHTYQLTLQDRSSYVASLAFDASIWECCPPLISGASLILCPEKIRLSPEQLYDWLLLQAITVSFVPTPLAEKLLDVDKHGIVHLRFLLTGGDTLHPSIDDHQPFCLVNHYGPTECSVVATAGIVDWQDKGVLPPSIGRPIDNVQIYVLDRDMQPVPIGVAGELYIGGDGLARGYFKQPLLTAERFVPHPWSTELGARLYRSGDQVRWRADGSLEFLGRLDDQVKIRGYRIEPAEIEAVLNEHPMVQQSAILAREDLSESKRLVAYLVLQSNRHEALVHLDQSAWRQQHLHMWQHLYDETYQQPSPIDDPTFNIVGWKSSETGDPIAASEMREWLDETVHTIARWQPRRILELGCGTGLLLFRLAGSCERYDGTDFSPQALRYVQQHLEVLGAAGSHVQLWQRAADELTDWEPASFDTIILNSVVQYFPDVAYLTRVLHGALCLLAPGGHLFIGDVRSLPLQPLYQTGLQLAQATASTSRAQLWHQVQRQLQQEEELVLAPTFFTRWAQEEPGVAQVEILPKRGWAHNELTRFRYQVILSTHPSAVSPAATPAVQPSEDPSAHWVSWGTGIQELDQVERWLAEEHPAWIGFRDLPNARLSTLAAAWTWLQHAQGPETVGGWQAALEAHPSAEAGVEPEELAAVADRQGYHIAFNWRDHDVQGRYDALLQRADVAHDPPTFPRVKDHAAAASHAPMGNHPLLPWRRRDVLPQLRAYLQAQVPDYMVPATFVLLETLPLTPNGKVDREALPTPDWSQRPMLSEEVQAPRTPIEAMVAELWQQVLGLTEIGITDDFFALGGHSLLATQIIVRIRETFQVDVPLRALFENPTVSALTEKLLQELVAQLDDDTLTALEILPSDNVQAVLVSERLDIEKESKNG